MTPTKVEVSVTIHTYKMYTCSHSNQNNYTKCTECDFILLMLLVFDGVEVCRV